MPAARDRWRSSGKPPPVTAMQIGPAAAVHSCLATSRPFDPRRYGSTMKTSGGVRAAAARAAGPGDGHVVAVHPEQAGQGLGPVFVAVGDQHGQGGAAVRYGTHEGLSAREGEAPGAAVVAEHG
jgi:hypothetical protein